jgi:hypothetical protein
MKRLVWLVPAILLMCSARVHAQELPGWELSGGYSYLEANLKGAKFHLNGGGGSMTENMNSWFGGRAEVNYYHGNEAGSVVSAQTITYGPVFTYRRFSRITPFAHFQVGVHHGSTGYLGISQSAFKFAAAPGGGVDLAINRRTAVRLDAEYLLTTFLGLTQHNVSGNVSLVFRFNYR